MSQGLANGAARRRVENNRVAAPSGEQVAAPSGIDSGAFYCTDVAKWLDSDGDAESDSSGRRVFTPD